MTVKVKVNKGRIVAVRILKGENESDVETHANFRIVLSWPVSGESRFRPVVTQGPTLVLAWRPICD